MRIFSFRPQTPFLGKFGPKNLNFQFELKFGTNLNKQNSMLGFTLSILTDNTFFCVNLVKKNENSQFELKFGT